MTNQQKGLLALIVIILALWASFAFVKCQPSVVLAQEFERPRRYSRGDVLLAAQACVHEATWAGGTETVDCGGIVQVVLNRQNEGETFASALRRTMPRFFAGRSDRAWARHLTFGPMRENPPGWPYTTVSIRNYDASWRAVFVRTMRYLEGVEALPCPDPVVGWMGRETDHRALERRLSSGFWRVSDCGPSRNVFLYQYDPE